MNNAWTIEFTRIVVVVIAILLFGLVSGYWIVAIIIPLAVYVIWMLSQIRALERWIRIGAKPSLALDSNGIWQLIVQHIVQTQRKNNARKTRLSQMANQFEAIIAALPDATVVINVQKEIVLTNKASNELLGIDKSRDIGQKIDNLIREPEFLRLVEGSEDQEKIEQIEIESPKDSLKTLSVSCVSFGLDQKLITARDISQRIAVQKLRKAFIANASHELRTPLTVISGYLELLDSESGMPDRVRAQIANAGLQANRMQKILDDLLLLSKLEEKGYTKDSGKEVDVSDLVNKLVSDFRKTKAKGTHEIEVQLDTDLKIKALETEVYSLCQNLLSNAVKYSPPPSSITVKWYQDEGGSPVLSIKDDGEGIAPEHMSRLTERFYRVNVDRSRQVGGTGLGLSIVKHILENYGGYLHIESELGKGSTFSAHFPRHRISNGNSSKGNLTKDKIAS